MIIAQTVRTDDANTKAAKVKEPLQELLFYTKALAAPTGKATRAANVAKTLRTEAAIFNLATYHADSEAQNNIYSLLNAVAQARAIRAAAAATSLAEQEEKHAATIIARMAQLRMLVHNKRGMPRFTAAAVHTGIVGGIFSSPATTCEITYANTPTTLAACLAQTKDKGDMEETGIAIQVTKMQTVPASELDTSKVKIKVAGLGALKGAGTSTNENNGCVANNGGGWPLATAANGPAVKDIVAVEPAALKMADVDHNKRPNQGCRKRRDDAHEEEIITGRESLEFAICILKALSEPTEKETAETSITSPSSDPDAQNIA
uniref:Variant surface glycoprotein 1125.2818 n=1 Tax=Trypanosoma brucei TaxID=5691 RepID=A0A1J0R8V5_9TRYP|nr:variant surface glycoprotein 1125.2818 [Trypanosoma brucei]